MRRALLALAALVACSRGDEAARSRVLAPEDHPAAPPPAAFDPARPEAALAMTAGEAARRLGAAFEWTAAVDWTVLRGGADGQRVRVTEHHQLRQTPADAFEVRAAIDPGLGPGSDGGKHVIFVDGMTYARALPAPFRERPTDRGRDARRFRDESFRLAGALAALYGPALALEAAGEETVLGRPARRYRIALAQGAAPPAPAPAPPGARSDPDTARRFAFLHGRVPTSAAGELLLDAATGVPLRVRLSGAFGVAAAPEVQASVELLAEVKAVGAGVAPIARPAKALPDDRKPAGPSTALEAAGLKKRGESPAAGAEREPGDEGE